MFLQLPKSALHRVGGVSFERFPRLASTHKAYRKKHVLQPSGEIKVYASIVMSYKAFYLEVKPIYFVIIWGKNTFVRTFFLTTPFEKIVFVLY